MIPSCIPILPSIFEIAHVEFKLIEKLLLEIKGILGATPSFYLMNNVSSVLYRCMFFFFFRLIMSFLDMLLAYAIHIPFWQEMTNLD